MIEYLLKSKRKAKKLLKLYNANYNSWDKIKRPSQTEPTGDWKTWLILAGRGFGKTRTGAETIKSWALNKKYSRIALIGNTISEARTVMVEGESGLLSIHSDCNLPILSKDTLLWSNGAKAFIMSATQSEKLRGPQFDAAWIDELAKFKNPDELFNQLMLCLRLGGNPKCIITTTPKPVPIIKRLMGLESTITTTGTTIENKENLAPKFLENLEKNLSRSMIAQEVYGELLDSCEGALWSRSMILYKDPSNLTRIIVAVDPAETSHDKSDETGIIVSGIDENGSVFILDDLSGKYSPSKWGEIVFRAYFDFKADLVIAEVNKGGDMVEQIIRTFDKNIPYKPIRATRGKITRAEPVAALYEKQRVFHTRPFIKLENQLCTYTRNSNYSPDRLDALVWAVTDLVFNKSHLKAWMV